MNAYKKDQERKRLTKAVKDKFPETKLTLADNTQKKVIRINNKTVVLAPEAAATLNIKNRYEQNN